MFFFRFAKYLEYLLFAGHRRGYGIHSPFVFDVVSRIFRNKIATDVVLTIESIRKKNISDKRLIQEKDLGAGSSKMKDGLRKVSEIARYSAIPAKYGALLSNMSAEFGNPVIFELGTSFGISTMYLAAANKDTIVYTIEGCPAVSGISLENFSIAGIENIIQMTGSFEDLLPELEKKPVKPGLVFIDGNHRKEPTLKYFRQLAKISGNNTVIILDDIYHSKEMEEAWIEIKKHKSVSFTIDIFRMGMVFFRKGMNHFDYIIRY
jgi:predicted O-methyltransferase YrrM